MGDWTDATPEALEVAMRHAKGSYQRNILRGQESLSGSTLRGKAVLWKGRYQRSCANLLARVASAGVEVSERREARGKRVLVLRMKGVT